MNPRTVVSDVTMDDVLAARVVEMLKPFGVEFVNGFKNNPNVLAQAEVLYTATGGLSAAQVAEAANLKWVHNAFVGVNRLLSVPEAVTADWKLTNGRGVITSSVADQVLAFMLMFARQMPRLFENQQRAEWSVQGFRDQIDQLDGQTVGLVGYGEIGSAIGKRAKAFGMRVIATRTNPTALADDLDRAFGLDQLPDLLAQSDWVVVTAPLTPQTVGLIGAAELARMKPSAYLINIARGQLVQEDALIKALQAGQLAGAGLDVTEGEPLPPASPLWKMPNVLITPHSAGLFKQLYSAVVELFCQNLQHYFKGEPLVNLVDKQRGY